MSAAIKERLFDLNEKVKQLEAIAGGLDGRVEALKKSAKAAAAKPAGGRQTDLFTVFTGGQANNANNDVMRSMASRLDSTIEKVEELLRQ